MARLASEIARAAGGLGSALEAELWASQLLGTFWRARYDLPFAEGALIDDPALEYGEPLLEQLARIDGPGAAIAVMAIAEVDDGQLGLHAKELLDTAGMWGRLPTWAADIAESEIIGAAVIRDPVFDDAQTVLLESRYADGQSLAVGVLIEHNLGGTARDVLMSDSIDVVDRTLRGAAADEVGDLVLEAVEPGVAAGLIIAAIHDTDITWKPSVEDDYWSGRALAALRSAQTRGIVMPGETPEMPVADREALRDEFLASLEGAGFASDGDEAWVAMLAIDFAADYLGRDPLRWSPAAVELFMLDWVPRKVVTTDAMLKVFPGALDAWLRFAARKHDVPHRALTMTRRAIGECTAEMAASASDPALAGPAKQVMTAAARAGVDVEDPTALQAFIAGWNGRSELDLQHPVGVDDRLDGETARPANAAGVILQVKIALAGISKPPVWRRLKLSADTPLDQLHRIIQAAFGWEDYHLHVFEAGREQFGPADPELELEFADERRFTLRDLAVDAGDRIRYTYDFGDSWRHDIVIEKMLEPSPGVAYPILVTAKGGGPPEDCGGVWGYENLKAVLADPHDAEHSEMREWLGLSDGERFDPTAVDEEAIRTALSTSAGRG